MTKWKICSLLEGHTFHNFLIGKYNIQYIEYDIKYINYHSRITFIVFNVRIRVIREMVSSFGWLGLGWWMVLLSKKKKKHNRRRTGGGWW